MSHSRPFVTDSWAVHHSANFQPATFGSRIGYQVLGSLVALDEAACHHLCVRPIDFASAKGIVVLPNGNRGRARIESQTIAGRHGCKVSSPCGRNGFLRNLVQHGETSQT